MHRRSFLVGLTTLAAPRLARADDLDAVLADIAKARGAMKTLVAPFTQERTIGLLATVVKRKGEMT